MTFPAVFYVHTVTVETYQGEARGGAVYAAGVVVSGFLDNAVTLTPGSSSDEVTSAGSTFYTAPENAGLFKAQSRVSSPDLGGDGKAKVVKVNPMTSGPLGLPDHVEVVLL